MASLLQEQPHPESWSVDRPWVPRDWQKWAVLAAGGALVGYGLLSRDRKMMATSVAGAALMYRGVAMMRDEDAGIFPDISTKVEVKRSISIQRPSKELYDFWADPENFPKFMIDVESVTPVSRACQHWVLKFPNGPRLEWDADVQKTDQRISWQTTANSPVQHSGSVEFSEGTHSGESRVRFEANYHVPGGILTRGVAMLAGRDPEQMARENLRRFKQWMEAGEIATTAGQPSGRSPLRNKISESLYHENRGIKSPVDGQVTATKRSA